MTKRGAVQALMLLTLFAAACGDTSGKPPLAMLAGKFKDDAAANTQVADGTLDLTLVDQAGQPYKLSQFKGQKNVVLVITRGFSGSVCPFCSAQTSRLVANYKQFQRRDAEVLLVFPGPAKHLPQFLRSVKEYADNTEVPFPILLDENLAATEQLGIKGMLAKPSTYILDKEGRVRFAYVGATTTDRPSVKAMLDQLDAITKE